MPFDKILEDGIIFYNKKYIKLIKVIPINYELKSNLEKEAILNSYKLFLKTCDFDIQIIIQSKKENLDNHIKKLNQYIKRENNEKIKNISENYINFIQKLNEDSKSSSKNFYILINYIPENFQKENEKNIENIAKINLKEKYLKIKECLSRCGNFIFEVNEEKEIKKILFTFFNLKNNFYN